MRKPIDVYTNAYTTPRAEYTSERRELCTQLGTQLRTQRRRLQRRGVTA
ncbi:MAG: hypothetical protein IPK82_00485 [Polyangiaceae bacterium]|nr:hypothetical protein [Polyangiaceae bacterium]